MARDCQYISTHRRLVIKLRNVLKLIEHEGFWIENSLVVIEGALWNCWAYIRVVAGELAVSVVEVLPFVNRALFQI